MLNRFWNDEAGFIVSAELILIATIAVLALLVGLGEVGFSVNQELEDVASAYGAVNQSYHINGTVGHQGGVGGSVYADSVDFCDNDLSIAGVVGGGEIAAQ